MKKRFEYEARSGRVISRELPIKFHVCETCKGKGTQVNPAIDGHGLTQEDFDADPEFEENYFSGLYDIACMDCEGQRVMPEIAEDRMTESQSRFWQQVERKRVQREQWEAEDRMTTFWENGGCY